MTRVIVGIVTKTLKHMQHNTKTILESLATDNNLCLLHYVTIYLPCKSTDFSLSEK